MYRRRGPDVKRRPKNIEGAFPLLLIGSVLLVYAAIIANQEIAAKGSHLPLWGLMAGVGAVIVGAGIYSTFLEPSIPSGSERPPGWVTVPKAEWDALRAGRRGHHEPRPSAHVPIWWEGPPEPTVVRAAERIVEAPPRVLRVVEPRLPPPTPRPPSHRRASLNDLKEALTELETLVNQDVRPLSGRRPKPGPDDPPSCVDCGRRLRGAADSSRCSGCGHRLCAECASSSRLEYTEVRCFECGVRAS